MRIRPKFLGAAALTGLLLFLAASVFFSHSPGANQTESFETHQTREQAERAQIFRDDHQADFLAGWFQVTLAATTVLVLGAGTAAAVQFVVIQPNHRRKLEQACALEEFSRLYPDHRGNYPSYYVGGDPISARVLLDLQGRVDDGQPGRGLALLRSRPTPKAALVKIPYASNEALNRLLLLSQDFYPGTNVPEQIVRTNQAKTFESSGVYANMSSLKRQPSITIWQRSRVNIELKTGSCPRLAVVAGRTASSRKR